MKTVWEDPALEQLGEVADYIGDRFGEKRADVFLDEVRHVIDLLEYNPYMGALDPLLVGRSESYRSVLVNKLNKLVYYVDENNETIHIAAFWDCRREPLRQTEHLN